MNTSSIIIDLPAPPSVNRTRSVDWVGVRLLKRWKHVADGYLMAARHKRQAPIKRFALSITMSEAHTEIDLDNGLKALIDYLRHIEVVENDAKRNMREIHVVWGDAPHGCRVEVRPV